MTEQMEFPHLKATEGGANIDLDNLDDLLAQLTAEELDELNGDFDPDNSLLPPSDRMKDQTAKGMTGPFNRKKLLAFLEKKAKEEKDWENVKQYVKSSPDGARPVTEHPWKAKEAPKKAQTKEEQDTETEWDDILREASEEELVDLAAVLGFHGMLNQTQFYASEANEKIETGGFTGIARPEVLKVLPFAPPNMTDVEASIKSLQDNDPKLKHLNLNNIKNISNERLVQICEALKSNTNVDTIEMASIAMSDVIAKKLAESLLENKTLRVVNVESNFLSGTAIVEILKAINKHQSVIELRVANQKPEAMGAQVESQILKLVMENSTILTLGMHFEFADCRIRTHEKLKNNIDKNLRKKRVEEKS